MFPLIEIETSREHLSQKILREYFHVHGNFVEKDHGQGLFIIFQGNFLSLLEIHGQKNNDHGPDLWRGGGPKKLAVICITKRGRAMIRAAAAE